MTTVNQKNSAQNAESQKDEDQQTVMTNNAKRMVDWDAAAALVAKATPAGPRLSRDEAAEVVAGLRQAAHDAVAPILETTRMRPAPGLPQDSFGDVLVVDRAGWAATNLTMMQQVVEPALAAVTEKLPSSTITPYGAAAEVAALMGVMAPRVLGQFDPYTVIGAIASAPDAGTANSNPRETSISHSAQGTLVPPSQNLEEGLDSATDAQNDGQGRGQLLLIAPNVAQTERKLEVDPRDFRLWVALHEQTHGLQFAAAPWLAPHLYGLIGDLLTATSAKTLQVAEGNTWDRLRNLFTLARDMFNSIINVDGPGPLEALLGPEEKLAFDTISATMALLEGHADVMMDEVGPAVVPTVTEIREKFEKRRDGEGQNKAGVLLRRALGMDAKLAQYRDGAVFVRGVEEIIGRDGFNAIWAGPENLPTPQEIEEPKLWVRRVHGYH